MAKATTAGNGKTETRPAKQKAGKPAKPNLFARLAQYLRDVRSEMKRVVWPDRPEIINSSVVLVVTLLFFVAFTFIVDSIVVQVLQLIDRIGS
jgi:preprotein translocase subunit SecE